MKVQGSHYKGIDFVRFNDLPEDQQAALRLNSEVERINILIDDKVVSNCIQFKDYSLWFTSVFKNPVITVEKIIQPVIVPEVALNRG